MTFLIVAMLLTVVQATPPAPRQSPNNSASGSQKVQSKAKAKYDTAAPPAPIKPSPASITAESSAGQGNDDASIQRNIEVFTGGLVVVGFLQCVIMFLQWRIYGRQAREMRRQRHEMRRQRHVMYRQWRAMQAQLGQMESASGKTDELITQAGKQADATNKSADAATLNAQAAKESIEMFISKERARLRIDMKPFLISPKTSSTNTVDFTVSIHGPTAAFITQTRCVTYVLTLEYIDSPDAGEALPFHIYNLPAVIPANSPPQEYFAFLFLGGTDEQKEIERKEIKAGKLFVGVRGFIKYRDVFDRERETSFRYAWKYSSMYNLGGDYGSWLECGTKEENQET
jgi:hypothetical protein